MRIVSYVFVALVAGLASCGGGTGVEQDTAGVAEGPRAPSGTTDLPSTPIAPSALALAGFAPGERFVVWDELYAGDSVVYDNETRGVFRIEGHPVADDGGRSDEFSQIGAPSRPITGDALGHIVVHTADALRLIDLADHGRTLAEWHGEHAAVSVAPDGTMMAVATRDEVHVVRTADSARQAFPATFGNDGPNVHWRAHTAMWVGAASIHAVDGATLREREWKSAPAGERVRYVATPDARVVVLATHGLPGAIEVHVDDVARPVARFASADIDDVAVSAAGDMVAWIERKSGAARAHMHTIDVISGAHARFLLYGSGCDVAPDSITAVQGGQIVTDASCSVGCPSVRWTRRSVTYDARSGRVVSDVSVEETRSYNDAQEELRGQAASVAEQLGVSLDVVTFSADGSLVAGVASGHARLWDAATGRSLLSR